MVSQKLYPEPSLTSQSRGSSFLSDSFIALPPTKATTSRRPGAAAAAAAAAVAVSVAPCVGCCCLGAAAAAADAAWDYLQAASKTAAAADAVKFVKRLHWHDTRMRTSQCCYTSVPMLYALTAQPMESTLELYAFKPTR
jgi:hypothetical protein